MSVRTCVRCGKDVPEGSEYCPFCGAAADGSAYDSMKESRYTEVPRDYGRRPDTLGVTPKLIMAYGILALLFGVLLVAAPSFTDWSSVADESGEYMGMTQSQYESAALICGAAFLASGVCALLSSLMASRRERFVLAFTACVLSSVVLLSMGLADLASLGLAAILCVIGLYMAYRIHINRDSFSS